MSSRCCIRAWRCGVQQLRQPRAARRLITSPPQRQTVRMASTGGCSKDTPKLSAEDLEQKVQELPNWRVDAGKASISRSFVARNFNAAIEFFQAVAEVAEAANHHPDLHLTNYRDVQVVLFTHAIGGVSDIDLQIAAQLDALDVDYSPKWLKQQEQQQK